MLAPPMLTLSRRMPSRSADERVGGAVAVHVPRSDGEVGDVRPLGLAQRRHREARGEVLDVHFRHQRVSRPQPLAHGRRHCGALRVAGLRGRRAAARVQQLPNQRLRRGVIRDEETDVAATGPQLRDLVVERAACGRQPAYHDDQPMTERQLTRSSPRAARRPQSAGPGSSAMAPRRAPRSSTRRRPRAARPRCASTPRARRSRPRAR